MQRGEELMERERERVREKERERNRNWKKRFFSTTLTTAKIMYGLW